MKLVKKEEVFEFEYSIEDPTISPYVTNRIVKSDGIVVWFGIDVNWKKENGIWYVLTTNQNAKPLKKYLPEIVYGSDRTIWVECEEPYYEKLYNEYYKDINRDSKINSIFK